LKKTAITKNSYLAVVSKADISVLFLLSALCIASVEYASFCTPAAIVFFHRKKEVYCRFPAAWNKFNIRENTS
jgi:hypothetical protein